MLIDSAIFIGEGFVIVSGRKGDLIIRDGHVTVIPLTMDEFELQLTLENLQFSILVIR